MLTEINSSDTRYFYLNGDQTTNHRVNVSVQSGTVLHHGNPMIIELYPALDEVRIICQRGSLRYESVYETVQGLTINGNRVAL